MLTYHIRMRSVQATVRACGDNAAMWLQVTAGTVNYEGALTIRASSTGQDSTLAGIAALVAEAQVWSLLPVASTMRKTQHPHNIR